MNPAVFKTYFGVTYYNKEKAYDGYTLFSPDWGKFTLLIDMDGNIVHMWKFNKRVGDFAYLLPNGNLIYPEKFPPKRLMHLGGVGNDLLEVDWNNNLVYKYSDPLSHHVVRRLRNGNTMFMRDIQVPEEIAKKIKGGIPNSEDDNGNIYGTSFREVDRNGNIVWEWKPWEHLDLSIYTICPLEIRVDWNHGNTIFEMPNGDILTSFRTNDMIFIIDKNTGKVKWQWGKGEIKHQHMATSLDNGNILCYDNGPHRKNKFITYSRVVEINPETNKIVWEYIDEKPYNFYAKVQSGALRLPNNNTLITEATNGRIFEVTYDKEIVWEYRSPFFYESDLEQCPGLYNWIHRAYRHTIDEPALKGKNLDPDNHKAFNLIYGKDAY